MTDIPCLPIFTFAEDYQRPIHRLCLESLQRHNPSAQIHTLASLQALPGTEELLERIEGLSLVHQSDVIRIWLLHQFGGVWIDADCLHLRRFEFPYEIQPGCELALCLNSNETSDYTNTILVASKPKLPFLARVLQRQYELIADKGARGLEWLDLGAWAIEHVRQREPSCLQVCPHWEFMYLAWYAKRRFLEMGRDWDFELDRGLYNPNAYCYHLTHAVLEFFEHLPREQLLTGGSFLSFLIRRSLGLGLAGSRTCELLQRLPVLHGEYRIAEVGVYLGDNIRLLGHQRCHATLVAVDRWGAEVVTAAYRATGDFHAGQTSQQHEENYREMQRRCWFLFDQGRLEVKRQLSVEAAEEEADESFDLVFLDADHSVPAVTSDIAAWWPKVKRGGWLSGHDYDHPSFRSGVRLAVDEFANTTGLPLELGLDYTWHIRKP